MEPLILQTASEDVGKRLDAWLAEQTELTRSAPGQHPQYRRQNDAGDTQQQPLLPGKAGPRRAVVVNPHQFQKSRKQRSGLPQLQMAHDPGLDPLIGAQQRRPQQAENHIVHKRSFLQRLFQARLGFRNCYQYTRSPPKMQRRESYAPPACETIDKVVDPP